MTTSSPQVQQEQRAWRQAAGGTVIVAGAVCLFMVTMLVLSVGEERRQTPLNAPEIAALKQELVERPNDEALKERIRQVDLRLRSSYFAKRGMLKRGAWLLVAAGAALAIALKSYGTLAAQPPVLTGERPDTWQQKKLARMGVAASGAILIAASGAWVVVARPELPEAKVAEAVAPPVECGGTWEGLAEFQGVWRGWGGAVGRCCRGVGMGPAGKGIAWKTAGAAAGEWLAGCVWRDGVRDGIGWQGPGGLCVRCRDGADEVARECSSWNIESGRGIRGYGVRRFDAGDGWGSGLCDLCLGGSGGVRLLGEAAVEQEPGNA